MTVRRLLIAAALITLAPSGGALAQTSSLGVRQREVEADRVPVVAPREQPQIERNQVYDRHSWITAAPPPPPKTYKVGDLLTIIVRERRKFEADADLETKKKFDVTSELDAFFKFTRGGIGATTFERGKPTVDYEYKNRLRSEGDTQREDRLTTRLTGKIIDVKPNGLLVLEARTRIRHDDEISTMTLTGSCRKEDVTADNTILSTQIADKDVVVLTEGALRAASSRGWIPKLIDLLKPF